MNKSKLLVCLAVLIALSFFQIVSASNGITSSMHKIAECVFCIE